MSKAMILVALVCLSCSAFSRGEPGHDAEFWFELRTKRFAVPPSDPLLPLALEATRLLGSPDPKLRDEVGYEALASWVYDQRRLTDQELNVVLATLVLNARKGLGTSDGDELYLRSFSILVLSVFAAADLKQPFLDQRRFDDLIDLALDELARERDLRGYTPGYGWGHATAHCADLLKFLSRSTHLRREQQARIVNGIAERLRSAGIVFVWGEDSRLASALASLGERADADALPFENWCERLAKDHTAVWTGAFDAASYVAVRAQLNTVAELSADLETDAAPGATSPIRVALHRLRKATR